MFMKKKLNLYCLMFIFAVGLGITIDFITGFPYMKTEFMEGWRAGRADAEAQWGEGEPYKYDDVHVNFLPKSRFIDNKVGIDSIYNENTKEKEVVEYDKMYVRVPKDKSAQFTSGDVFLGVGCIIYYVGIIGFWVVFFLAIRSVKQGDVFLQSVASYLTKAAIFLLVAYAGEWFFTWADYEHAKELVKITNYELYPNFQYNNSNLYIAFGLMLLSQIIKSGKELKEEQDLTI